MPDRRALDFDGPAAVINDVDRLLRGHTVSGDWTLGEILDHLARAIRLTARPAGPQTPATLEGDAARAAFFERRTITTSRPIPSPLLVPDPEADPGSSADALRKALARLEAAEGPFPSHPFLGPLSRDEWIAFHLIHCAHHLSFAHPA